ILHFWEDCFVYQQFSSLSARAQCSGRTAHPQQCDYSEARRHCPLVKHSLNTVNPLIAHHVNPFLPSVISTVSVLFFLALITVLVSLGMSVTLSQFPPQCQNVPQSRY
ncbi:unnamed protein product, partial [Staurois parvus]